VVEPCLSMCRYVERAAESFGLKLDIWCLTAEGMDALPAAAFDHCIFNASLHHCDDPVQALLNCNRLLVPGGQVLLLNEPLLKIFVAKSSYYRRLEEKPEEMGHYGGNEHIYYHHEYIHMLRRTGFSKVRGDLASFYFAPRHQLALLKHQRVPPWRILARRIYYSLLRAIHFSGPAGRPALNLMRRLSVLATNFQATKQAA
jgi:SAM-dependent methyltransferase